MSTEGTDDEAANRRRGPVSVRAAVVGDRHRQRRERLVAQHRLRPGCLRRAVRGDHRPGREWGTARPGEHRRHPHPVRAYRWAPRRPTHPSTVIRHDCRCRPGNGSALCRWYGKSSITEGVAAAQVGQAGVPLRAVGFGAGGGVGVGVDLQALRGAQGVELQLGVLVGGGHPRVPDSVAHGRALYRNSYQRRCSVSLNMWRVPGES